MTEFSYKNLFTFFALLCIFLMALSFYSYFDSFEPKQNIYEGHTIKNTLKQISLSNASQTGEAKDHSANFNYEEKYSYENLEKNLKSIEKLENENVNFWIKKIDNICITDPDNQQCLQDFLNSCAYATVSKLELAKECSAIEKNILENQVTKFQEEKKLVEENPYLDTDLGEYFANENIEKIYSETINPDKSELNKYDFEQIQRMLFTDVEKELTSPLINQNTYKPISQWIEGWGTVFAVKGGKNEAGFKMNALTAFGYNPYHRDACILSLPYKTVDYFYGTHLDSCIKNKKTLCIIADKAKVKGKPIEFVLIKNGKTGVLPLGDLGPAEWTRNAIDFTSCDKENDFGLTGKDLVRFRAVE